MNKTEDKNTRYYIEIDLITHKVINNGFDHKLSEYLDRGRQNNPKIHRLLLTKGQYNKLVNRCTIKSNLTT